ncbi:hypothetical protein BGZ80_001779, partial [Entomortierella chlamydospora]
MSQCPVKQCRSNCNGSAYPEQNLEPSIPCWEKVVSKNHKEKAPKVGDGVPKSVMGTKSTDAVFGDQNPVLSKDDDTDAADTGAMMK